MAIAVDRFHKAICFILCNIESKCALSRDIGPQAFLQASAIVENAGKIEDTACLSNEKTA